MPIITGVSIQKLNPLPDERFRVMVTFVCRPSSQHTDRVVIVKKTAIVRKNYSLTPGDKSGIPEMLDAIRRRAAEVDGGVTDPFTLMSDDIRPVLE